MGAEREMVLRFPQPSSRLGLNGRAHWAVRFRETVRMRQLAFYRVCSVLRGDVAFWSGFVPGCYSITWYYWCGAGPDVDNVVARCKALLDGCADGFGINDRVLELGQVSRVKVKRADARAGMVGLRFYGTEVPGSDRKEYDE